MFGRRSLMVLGLSFLAVGCGASATVATTTPSTSPAGLSERTIAASPSPISAASGFSCSPLSGGTSTAEAQLTDVSTAHFPGYDQITFGFAAPISGGPLAALPAWNIASQASADFVHDASGERVSLEGSAGLRIVMHGASGYDNLAPSPRQTYTGSIDQKPGLPEIRELSETGDYERVLGWGVGLSSAACFRVGELLGPGRLVVDVAAA